ncbi:DUF1524 domain-containing protein [Mycetocola sp. JXN-3]|uniref:GmrSD restriction endonuclease domain-containing protein n=1 Tax=Mycetocola sp. JXN-3 TaxID=2116510 RepID=UPI00351C1BED
MMSRSPRRPVGISTAIVAAVIVVLASIMTVSHGTPGLLATISLAGICTGLYVLISGRGGWARLPESRAIGGAVLGGSMVLIMIAVSISTSNTSVPEARVPGAEPSASPRPSTWPSALPGTFNESSLAMEALDALEVLPETSAVGIVDQSQFDVYSGTKQRVPRGTHDAYTGLELPINGGDGAVVVDHVVSLENAWATGAQDLSPERRRLFATDPINTVFVAGLIGRNKAGADASKWLPYDSAYRCSYVARQVSVKAVYGLWVTPAERASIADVLVACPQQRTVKSSVTSAQPRPASPSQREVGPSPAIPTPVKPAPARPAPTKSASPPVIVPEPEPIPEVEPDPEPLPLPELPMPLEPAPTSERPPSNGGAVGSGKFCSQSGSIGYSVNGKRMVCTRTSSDSRLRWRSG